jgi:hypothetical protein
VVREVAVGVALLGAGLFDSRTTEQSDAKENGRRGELAESYGPHVGSSYRTPGAIRIRAQPKLPEVYRAVSPVDRFRSAIGSVLDAYVVFLEQKGGALDDSGPLAALRVNPA